MPGLSRDAKYREIKLACFCSPVKNVAMNKLYFLLAAVFFLFSANAQESNSILFAPAQPLPVKHRVLNAPFESGPKNGQMAHRTTSPGMYSDWYDLWDEMFDTTVSYSYSWDLYPDSNLYDNSGIYPPYNVFTHGMGMSFDPSDSAYYYHAYNLAYRVSAPFPFKFSYQLDSFWVPGEYLRYDTTSANVDSLIIEFLVTQNGGAPPDSGAYSLMATTPESYYFPCTADESPRFAVPRYFRATDDCIDPVLTTTAHQRYAFPLTAADEFIYKKIKFALTTPITVKPGKYLAAYVYFKSQVAYPLGTNVFNANYYWLYAGEPNGANVWFAQSAHNTIIDYPGSHQDGLIATNQIAYNDAGFVYNSHNILLPSFAYANSGANLSPGFDVPEMAFHINWSYPDTSLAAENMPKSSMAVNLFPNPCTDVLHVSFTLDHKSDVQVSLLSMTGQIVANRKMGYANSGDVILNIAALPAGIYTCMLYADGERFTGRVVIAH